MINTAKPTTSITNISKIDYQETWDSNTSTWNTETRTWNDTASKMTNTSKPSTTITNLTKPS